MEYANLKAYMRGEEMTTYQKADALIEFNKLLQRLEYLEQRIEELTEGDRKQLFNQPDY